MHIVYVLMRRYVSSRLHTIIENNSVSPGGAFEETARIKKTVAHKFPQTVPRKNKWWIKSDLVFHYVERIMNLKKARRL